MKEESRSARKAKTATVISNKMQKTVVVSVKRTILHPRYGKVVTRSKKFNAHTESNDLQPGDKVLISETRPLSKTKRWRVVEKIKA